MSNKKTVFLFSMFFLCAVLLTFILTFCYISKNYAEKNVDKIEQVEKEEKLTKTEARKFFFEDVQKCSDAFWSGNADIQPDCAKQREEYMSRHWFTEWATDIPGNYIDDFTFTKQWMEKFYKKNANGGFEIDSVIQSHFMARIQQDYKNYEADESDYKYFSIRYLLKPESDFPIKNQKVCEIFKESFNKELYLKNLNKEFGQDYLDTKDYLEDFQMGDPVFNPGLWTGDPDVDLSRICLFWPEWGWKFDVTYFNNNALLFSIDSIRGYPYYPY